MARSRSRDRRVVSTIDASDQLLVFSDPLRSSRDLTSLEDRRRFYPGVFKPAVISDRGRRAFLSLPKAKTSSTRSVRFSPTIAFERPDKVLICVRRHRRREVLFAKKRAGRGGMRRPRRNAFSSYSCGGR